MVGSISLSLAEVMGFNRKDAVQPQVEKAAFGEELNSAITTARQEVVGVADIRPAVSPAAAAAADTLAPIAASNKGSVFDLENPIPKVQDLLIKMGINPAEIQFELLDDVNSNPLGTGHINHLLRVRTPNGWKEDYAVEYINRNANITANEIAGLRRLPTAPEHLRGV